MTVLDLQFGDSVASGLGLEPIAFEFRHQLGELFELEVIVQSKDPNVDFRVLIGRSVNSRLPGPPFGTTIGVHTIQPSPAIIHRVEQVSTEPTGVSRYRLVIVPDLFLLTLRTNCRVFRNPLALGIVRKLLEDYEGRVEPFKYSGPSESPESRAVQYGESDYDFLRWVLADAGLTFSFKDGWTIDDDTRAQGDFPSPLIPFVPPSLDAQGEAHASAVHLSSELRRSKAIVREYLLGAPDLKVVHKAGALPPLFAHEPKLERVEYETRSVPNNVERRLDAERATGRVIVLTTNFPHQPGAKLRLDGFPREDVNRELLVIACRGRGDSTLGAYELECIDATTRFRPIRHPPPRIIGTQTAVVSGYHEFQPFTECVVDIQFQWQRADNPEHIRARVSQAWAGPGYGLFCHPRIGDEVIVEFLDGDPGQPIIVGRVHNGKNRAPLDLPKDRAISTWKSHAFPSGDGFNQILFDDDAKKMRLELHAHHSFKSDTGENSVTIVGGNSTNTITGGYGLSAGSTAIATGAFTLNAKSINETATFRFKVKADSIVEQATTQLVLSSLGKARLFSSLHMDIIGNGGITLRCGDSTSIVLSKTGIILKAETITIDGTSGDVDVRGKPIKLNCT